MKNTTRAVAPVVLILGLAVMALLAPKVIPSVFDKRTREAAESAAASAKVEAAVSKAVESERAKGAAVSASVNQLGVAAGQLPSSPQAMFITRELSFITPLLPPPDPQKLLEAERRRVAILEGRLEQADAFYRQGARDNEALLARALKAEARTAAVIADRREVDTRLMESAAVARGKDMVIAVLTVIAVLAVALWLYLRFWMHGNTVGFDALAEARAMVLKGEKDVENAFDGIVDRKHWPKVAALVDTYFSAKDHKPKA